MIHALSAYKSPKNCPTTSQHGRAALRMTAKVRKIRIVYIVLISNDTSYLLRTRLGLVLLLLLNVAKAASFLRQPAKM